MARGMISHKEAERILLEMIFTPWVNTREEQERQDRDMATINRSHALLRAEQGKRRARKRGASVGTDRRAYKNFMFRLSTDPDMKCHWCGRPTIPAERHADHVIPIAKGGADSVYNLCCSCPTCNQQKGAKLPEAFTGQAELSFTG